MYPILFRIGDFEVTSFGVLVALGAIIGLWLFRRELARSRLPENSVDAGLFGVIGGLVGAKLLWVAEHFGEEPFVALLVSRGGLSWFGGLVGGIGAGLTVIAYLRLPIVSVLAAATPALAIGHAIGRVGCFLVGDDYGSPSDLPWAVAFPEGLPPTVARVHPTQIYEALPLVIIGWALLKWRRTGVTDAAVLGRYCILTGSLRFAIEFIRVNVQIAGPFTVAQLLALGVIVIGAGLIVTAERTRP